MFRHSIFNPPDKLSELRKEQEEYLAEMKQKEKKEKEKVKEKEKK